MSIDPTAYGRQVEPQSLSQGAAPRTGAAPENTGFRRLERAVFGADGLTFGDLLDVINPLQHVPVVATIYRSMSGDSIAPGPRLAGGGLFGGLIGLAGAAVNLAIEKTTGKDIGGHMLALLTGDGGLPGNGFGFAPGAVYVADLEPHERVAALIARNVDTAPTAAPALALAGTPGAPEFGSERAAEPAPVIASAPLIDGLDLAGLEPDQRVAALRSPAPAQGSAPALAIAAAESAGATASSAPRPGAASASDGAERLPSRAPGASAPPQPGAGLGSAPFGPLWQPAAYAPGVASASAGAIPSLSSLQWQALTQALRAYGERPEAQAQPISLRYDSQQ
jgi:hypothetical protein